ncbi:MAG: FHA domain-containing protein [Bradymonadia bacterium]
MLRLIIEDDEGKTTVVPLIRDEITIGRKEGNTIRLTERNVSRRHARLLRAGETGQPSVIVEDLDSNNGVRLNGDRIAGKCVMRPGDLVQIGDYSLALQLDAPGASPTGDNPAVRADAARDGGLETQTQVRSVKAEEDTLPAEQRGKLVVVSSNLGGETFELGRREIIIGRTDENDVVVNHRSISRNHAKIVVRDASFTIIDLASSNGVKVNGEQFGTVTLVNGDIIELGHVKLRFVGPGESYTFTPADIDDVALESSASTGRLVVIALLLAAIAIGTFYLVRKPTPAPVNPTIAGSPAIPSSPPPTAAPEAPVDVKQLLAEARGHLEREDFASAERVFDRALQSTPENPEALAGRALAQSEGRARGLLATLRESVENGEWADAYLAAVEFPTDSRYTPEAQKLRKQAEPKFGAGELKRGLDLIESNQLDGARAIQQDLQRRGFSEAGRLASAIKAAEAGRVREADPPSVASRPTPPSGAPAPASAERRPPDERRPSGSDADYEGLVAEGLKLMALGRREEAAELYERAHKLRTREKLPHQRLCAIYPPMGRLERALYHCKKYLDRESNPGYKPAIELKIQQIEQELKK